MKQIVSWMILTSLLIGNLALALHVKPAWASTETVYINIDGSVSPEGALSSADNITYTFTGDISYPAYYGIVVQRSNIVLDGFGYTVQGNATGKGIDVTSINNVTIKNVNVNSFWYGIYLSSSVNITVTENNAANNTNGIYLHSSSNSTVSGNNAANNSEGIWLTDSSLNNMVSGNNATSNTDHGILLGDSSTNNTITGNNATKNSHYGIYLYSSSNNNTITGNNVTANIQHGIFLGTSSNNNTVSRNNATNNFNGIYLHSSSNNTVSENSVTANTIYGIYLYSSSNDTITANNMTDNPYGLGLQSASNNTIYHNNFIDNYYAHAYVDAASLGNAWNITYPSGGNYWGNYTGNDTKWGPYQDQLGSDGMGDTNHTIDASNRDYYPLMAPWPALNHDVAVTNVTTCKDGCSPFPTVGQNRAMHINVTVENQGNIAKAFNVTVYANTTMINRTLLVMPSASSTVLKFVWNATLAYGNYTLSAVADTVSGEVDDQDNARVGSTVFVTIPGDIDGTLWVRPMDLNALLIAYGSPTNPEAPYNPNADLDNDHKVGPIDLNDLLVHYGQHYP